MGWLKWVVLILIVGIAWLVWYNWPKTPSVITKLEMQAIGGFAYIQPPDANELSIAFLADYKTTEPDPADVCDVDQLGVDLMVTSGTIVSVASSTNPPLEIPANRTFKLAGAEVRFPDLVKSSQPLVINRGNRPTPPGPFGPVNPGDWDEVKWVPGMSYAKGRRAPAVDYPNSKLNLKWLEMIDGRVVLEKGVISAAHPSDVAAKDSIFQFKSKSGVTNPFQQAITDTTIFRADIPADQIVINLTGAESRFTQIVIKPALPNRPVRLKLKGLHAHNTPPELGLNEPIHHFCAFYQLLSPVPSAKDQLIPHRISGPTIAALTGQPSPGPFCAGDWYPE
jgi:hypothetical protein